MSVATRRTGIEAGNSSISAEPTSALACHCASPGGAKGGGQLPLLPAIALVLLPKCPLCFAAWFGVLGSFAAGSWLRSIWGLPMAATLLSFAIGSLALRARRRGNIRPLLTGVLGALALLGGKYLLDLPYLAYSGLILLIGSSLWSSWPQPSRAGDLH